MKEKILNVWSSEPGELKYYEAEPFYQNGEWEIHKTAEDTYLHSHKKVAFTERCAPYHEMIDSMADGASFLRDKWYTNEMYERGQKFRIGAYGHLN